MATTEKRCPECGEAMEDSIDYRYGQKTADGWRCHNGDCRVVHIDYHGDVTYE